MYKIDLNSDLGEGAACDSEIIPLVSSANIACGWHAGSSTIMDSTLELCEAHGVSAGAHPGYPDRENFGRTAMPVTPDQVYDFTLYQLGALGAMAKAKGISLAHVKPHGAMYNMAAKDIELSRAIANAVFDYDPNLILLALSGSKMVDAARERGVRCACEVFADRAYQPDATLRPRTLEGAMITDENEAIDRVIHMVKDGVVRAYSGENIAIQADSVCVHGDGAKALNFVRALRSAFEKNDIKIVPLSEMAE